LAINTIALAITAFAPKSAHAQAANQGLEHQVQALETEVQTLETEVAALQANPALELGRYVTVDQNAENGLNGPNVIFKGVNVRIESGNGSTVDTETGLGDLVTGYDEDSANPTIDANRRGSNNLSVSADNEFTASGTIVGGHQNFTSANFASITGGAGNIASGEYTSVSGGVSNTASGMYSSVGGGENVT
jgi:hypothetical protein